MPTGRRKWGHVSITFLGSTFKKIKSSLTKHPPTTHSLSLSLSLLAYPSSVCIFVLINLVLSCLLFVLPLNSFSQNKTRRSWSPELQPLQKQKEKQNDSLNCNRISNKFLKTEYLHLSYLRKRPYLHTLWVKHRTWYTVSCQWMTKIWEDCALLDHALIPPHTHGLLERFTQDLRKHKWQR